MSRLSRQKTLPALRKLFALAPASRRDRLRAGVMPLLEGMESRALLSTLHVGSSPGEFHQIQAAVLAANPGDTIQVDPGTYKEQVTIDKNSRGVTLNNLTLKGSNQTSIIQLPTTAPASPSTAIVEVTGAKNVTIDKFTIEGPGSTPNDSIGYGIVVDGGGSANITNNLVTHIRDNPLSGNQNGIAIEIGLSSATVTATSTATGMATGTATISHNTIDDYQKAGIVVDNTGSSAEIDHNTVTGVGPTNVTAQDGIQISNGATADVNHNTISGNVYTPQTYASTGILLYAPGAVTVDHNTVSGNDYGIYSYEASAPDINHNQVTNSTFDGIVLDTTTGARVDHNTTDHNGFGALPEYAVGDGGIALINSPVGTDTNNTIDHNQSANNMGAGIFVDSASTDNLFDQNQLSGNTIDAEDQSVGAGTDGTGNTWTKNHGKTSSPPGLVS